MAAKRADRTTQVYRDQLVDELVRDHAGLYTYTLAGKRLKLARDTVRRYAECGWLEKVVLDTLPLITHDSIMEFEVTYRRYNPRRTSSST
jgi:hypothetical protein